MRRSSRKTSSRYSSDASKDDKSKKKKAKQTRKVYEVSSNGDEENEKTTKEFSERLATRKKAKRAKKGSQTFFFSFFFSFFLWIDSEAKSAASAEDWVSKMRAGKTEEPPKTKKKKKKKKGLDMASKFDDQDTEFSRDAYTSKDLKGLTVAHDIGSLEEGKQLILTLADSDVLGADGVKLESRDLVQREKSAAFVEYKKNEGKANHYDVYDHDADILSQYDEKDKKSFSLGSKQVEERLSELKNKVQAEANKMIYDAGMASGPNLASDRFTVEEMEQFKKKKKKMKPKKKKRKGKKGENNEFSKKSKRRKKKETSSIVESLLEDKEGSQDSDEDVGSREHRKNKVLSDEAKKAAMMQKEITYQNALKAAMRKSKFQLDGEDEEEEREFLQRKKTRGKKAGAQLSVAEKLAERLRKQKERKLKGDALKFSTKKEAKKTNEEDDDKVVLTSASEFVKMVKLEKKEDKESRKRKQEKAKELVKKQEAQMMSQLVKKEEEQEEGEITQVDEEAVLGLEKEPIVSSSMASAVRYLAMKGEDTKTQVVSRLTDKSVSRSNPSYMPEGTDEAGAVEERFNLDLTKYDEFGRPVSRKEAFRLQAQGFHGTAGGAMAQERRLRKLVREIKMKEGVTMEAQMKNLEKVERRQKKTGSAAINLTMGTNEYQELQEQAQAKVREKYDKKNKL